MFQGSSSTRVLDIVPLPELHLMSGAIVDNMLHYEEEDTKQWLRNCHVEKDVTCHGSSFNGNS